MGPIIDAWFVLVVAVAGFLNREQNKILEYLLAESVPQTHKEMEVHHGLTHCA